MIPTGYKELRNDPRYTGPLLTDDAFIRGELDLGRPAMKLVRNLIAEGDAAGARDAYLRIVGEDSAGRYYFGADDVPAMMTIARELSHGGEEAREAIEEADRIVAGDIPLFKGRRAVFPEGDYDWNSWLHDSSQYQLHLTRFGYLKYLSRAYCLTSDEKYAACFNGMMKHFILDCPMPVDDTFRSQHCTWDPLSVGVRMFNLPEAFMTFYRSPSFEPEVKMMMIKSFQEHARYVRRYHASHGNHACMQLRGLIQVALLLPELKEAAEWLEYGLSEMPAYIRQNVYEDGVQFEGSPNYHLVVMRDVYELYSLFQGLGMEAAVYREVLERMFEVFKHLLTPDGGVVRFGDTDVHAVGELRTILSLGAYLLNRGDLKFLGQERLPFSLLWRLGPDAVERYDRLQAQPPADTTACFPIGGYLVARQAWERTAMHMAMRAGIGIAGHAHSDALSFIAYSGGRELVADAGMGLFEWNKERKYVVSTRAHNTVVVDGQDQHVRGMHWSTPPTATCKIWDFRSETAYDYWFASHYGYTRYEDPVVHSRKVLFVKNRYWLIVDLFEAKGRHEYEQYYHLPTGEAVADWRGRSVRTVHPDANVLLAFPGGEQEDRLSLESGLIFMKGQYDPNPVVKRAMSATGRAAWETVILPYGTKEASRIAIERLPVRKEGIELASWQATGLRITGQGWSDDICLYHDHVDVTAYLDHTGNPVSPALLPKPAETGMLEFAGERHSRDVMMISK
ncbi:alginate lyase family protein [Paenibacillus filicis]|uniref:Alginate lyase family protein n=1 Tax=Paenibacillus filicis TaxID=669464 RepID=A0ABU9DGS1_9BACL